MVSPANTLLGVTVAITATFPLKLGYNNLVSLLSLNGICVVELLLNALITFPSALKEVLINLASLNLIPLELVSLTLSDPAKSIIVNLDTNECDWVCLSISSIKIV